MWRCRRSEGPREEDATVVRDNLWCEKEIKAHQQQIIETFRGLSRLTFRQLIVVDGTLWALDESGKAWHRGREGWVEEAGEQAPR